MQVVQTGEVPDGKTGGSILCRLAVPASVLRADACSGAGCHLIGQRAETWALLTQDLLPPQIERGQSMRLFDEMERRLLRPELASDLLQPTMERVHRSLLSARNSPSGSASKA